MKKLVFLIIILNLFTYLTHGQKYDCSNFSITKSSDTIIGCNYSLFFNINNGSGSYAFSTSSNVSVYYYNSVYTASVFNYQGNDSLYIAVFDNQSLCTDTLFFTPGNIFYHTIPQISPTTNLDSCDGSIIFTLHGGQTPYYYYNYHIQDWEEISGDSLVFENLCASPYNHIEFKDHNNCQLNLNYSIGSADTGIVIYSFLSNENTTCTGFYNDSMGFEILAYNVVPNSIVRDIYWGDGTHESQTFSYLPNYYYLLPTHNFTTPGTNTIMIIVSSIPGGYSDTAYYTLNIIPCEGVQGYVYLDLNNDCSYSNNETGISGAQIMLSQGNTNVYSAWTGNNGQYNFGNLPIGNYTIELIDYQGYSLCSNSQPQNITLNLGSTVNVDFGLSCGNFDIGVNEISLMNGFFPGDQNLILPHVGLYNNLCDYSHQGEVIMVLSPLLTYDGTYTNVPNPTNIIHATTGDTLKWDISDINNIGTFSYWDYAVNVTTSTNAQIGDTACITIIVLPETGDVNPMNNHYTRCFAIGNSYDPNEKSVDPKGIGTLGEIAPSTEKLTYTIRFQNTGNATAHNIYILDTLDNNLDISSLNIVSKSHNMQTYQLPGNVLKFIFADIMLPDSNSNSNQSHGYVTYSIAPKQGLSNGSQIANSASIYFDYNIPIQTNTTINTINDQLGINSNQLIIKANVFPNPASTYTEIELYILKEQQSTIVLCDIFGRKISSFEQYLEKGKNNIRISTSNLNSGLYYVQIRGKNDENQSFRFVKE